MLKRICRLLLPDERKMGIRVVCAVFLCALLDFAGLAALLPVLFFLLDDGRDKDAALSRFKGVSDKKGLFRRLGKRILLLWIFGMMCQGNLLGLDPDRIYLYSNTLQSIAAGYLITAVLFLYTSRRTQIGVAVALLLVYWAAMQFITVGSYGGGNYTPEGNLAEWIDRAVLGRFRDGAKMVDGEIVFAPWYHYTWILSTLNFGVTVLTGLFAGYIAKDKTSDIYKLKWYFGAGAVMVAAGWLWGLQMPVIKTIWTSSMDWRDACHSILFHAEPFGQEGGNRLQA